MLPWKVETMLKWKWHVATPHRSSMDAMMSCMARCRFYSEQAARSYDARFESSLPQLTPSLSAGMVYVAASQSTLSRATILSSASRRGDKLIALQVIFSQLKSPSDRHRSIPEAPAAILFPS